MARAWWLILLAGCAHQLSQRESDEVSWHVLELYERVANGAIVEHNPAYHWPRCPMEHARYQCLMAANTVEALDACQ